MKKLTIISHFYNEEYLLPWWLNHHKEIFDHGILINYNSTDNSVDLIKQICPTWEVVNSANEHFSAEHVDQEVMNIENSIEGYKICLNTTEFLVGVDVKNHLDYSLQKCHPISRATVVDDNPSIEPTYEYSLINQKYFGFIGNNGINGQFRYIHNYDNGSYDIGRHSTHLPLSETLPFLIFWYGFAPWNEKIIQRKLQIKNKIPLSDQQRGFGSQHMWEIDRLEEIYKDMYSLSSNLLTE